MDSNGLLLFRGRALKPASGSPLVVYPSSPSKDQEGVRLELRGSHAEVVAAALQLAALPVFVTELASLVAERCHVEEPFVRDLLEHLVENEILLRVVPVAERLNIAGDRALSNALRAQMKSGVWPSQVRGVAVWALGTLGSTAWRESFHAARASAELALTWSAEGSGAWLGPIVNDACGPCPACLVAWRTAVDPTALSGDLSIAYNPPALAAMCQQVILRAEEFAANLLAPGEIVFVSAKTFSVHYLLRQPGCPYCSESKPSLASAAQIVQERFVSDFSATEDAEPSEFQRAAFLDALLGPIELATHDAPDLFRGVPLTLGSLRMLLPREEGFQRRHLFSITFGAGVTASRRHLVAFAEGIERYALFVDRPDVIGKRFSELGADAFPPAETIRFATQQFSGKAGAPVPYEDQLVDWSWAFDFTSNRARLVIHDVFTADGQASSAAVRWVQDPFSSGAAAHRSLPRAMRRALLELIERDALMLAWYLRLPLAEFDLTSSLNPELRELYGYLTARGIELRCFDLRVDFDVPTVLLSARASVTRGQWLLGGRIVSASASGNWEDAIIHSLHEILGHYSASLWLAPEGDSSLDPTTGEPHLWWSNFGAYFKPRLDDPFSFLGSGTPKAIPESAAEESVMDLLFNLRAQFLARELPVFIHYLAPETVRASGLLAVRACVPGLVRMTPSLETVNFGEPRIEQIRTRWGALAGFNALPHPIT